MFFLFSFSNINPHIHHKNGIEKLFCQNFSKNYIIIFTWAIAPRPAAIAVASDIKLTK